MELSKANINVPKERNIKHDFFVNDDLELNYNQKRGLHIKARDAIRKNEILFAEEKQASAPIIEEEFQDQVFYFLSGDVVINLSYRSLVTSYILYNLPEVILFLLFDSEAE